ncbi:MAG TPA: polyprenyl synthetase family protein [Thermomicrobiales bacterium]|nr:polyprenyl synthetase family protein [Thermomicrobiales bacterium]
MDSPVAEQARALVSLETEMQAAIHHLDGSAPLLARMVRFHLGWIDPSGADTDAETRALVQGKRIRPLIAQLCSAAVGGDVEAAAPLAAAIELLHNFTLIHDDIQDRSPNRRHRATVWRIWGDAQAINAGDALFAAAQLSLLNIRGRVRESAAILALLEAFNRVTIEIVRGQVIDLEFEARERVSSSDYLQMIGAKTAAIIQFAAWSGATVGGASHDIAYHLGEMGMALGMGFQIRDDVLGIWGPESVTGKAVADDIRRRKKSLPILMLMERASPEEIERLARLYRSDEVDGIGIETVLTMLDQHHIESLANSQVRRYHDAASNALEAVSSQLEPLPLGSIGSLIQRLDSRIF